MNLCVFTGRLTKKPELKTTKTGKSVLDFSIAINEGKDKNKEDLVTYANCQAWESTAESIVTYFDKGKPITVQARLRNEKWEGENGEARRSERFIVDRFFFVPYNNKQESEDGGEEAVENEPKKTVGRKPRSTTPKPSPVENSEFVTTEEEDDIPF